MSITTRAILNKPLKDLCTFGIGGPAAYYIAVQTIAEMQEILPACMKEKIPFFILGKGSNSLFDDRGFNGCVIANKIDFLEKKSETLWHVGAGYSFSLLGTQTARQGLSGLEFACGIPGSVGGAIYMNAGANGSTTSLVIEEIDYVTNQGELVHYSAKDLAWGNRHSFFQTLSGAIVSATFRLTPQPDARQKQIDLFQQRKKTQPIEEKSAGCIFVNPPSAHAGALIDRCGLKQMTIGGAQVSPKHANFIVNAGGATANDVKALIAAIQSKVKAETGYDLTQEVRSVPYDPRELS